MRTTTVTVDTIPALPAETDWGLCEYKRRLVGLSDFRKTQLGTQMKWRLREGHGYAEYHVGIGDNGAPVPLSDADYDESLATLLSIATTVGAEPQVLHRQRSALGSVFTITFTIRTPISALIEYRWMVIGASQVGKTTLVGCMMDPSSVDDGHGCIRNKRLRHMHELETGSNTQPLYAHRDIGDGSAVIAMVDFPGGARYTDDVLHKILALRPTGIIHVVRADHRGVQPYALIDVLQQSGLPIVTVILNAPRIGDAIHGSPSGTALYPVVNGYPDVPNGCTAVFDTVVATSTAHMTPPPLWRCPPMPSGSVIVSICDAIESFDLGVVVHGVVVCGTLRVGTHLKLVTANGCPGSESVFRIDSLHRYRQSVYSVTDMISVSFALTYVGTINNRALVLTIASVLTHMTAPTVFKDVRNGGLLVTVDGSVPVPPLDRTSGSDPVITAGGIGAPVCIGPCIRKLTARSASVPLSSAIYSLVQYDGGADTTTTTITTTNH